MTVALSAPTALLLNLYAELFNEEGPAVGGFLDDFCGRFAGAVTGFGFDPNQYGFVTTLGSLQSRGELETVRGHDAIIVIGGRDQRRRITTTFDDVMQRRVSESEVHAQPMVNFWKCSMSITPTAGSVAP